MFLNLGKTFWWLSRGSFLQQDCPSDSERESTKRHGCKGLSIQVEPQERHGCKGLSIQLEQQEAVDVSNEVKLQCAKPCKFLATSFVEPFDMPRFDVRGWLHSALWYLHCLTMHWICTHCTALERKLWWWTKARSLGARICRILPDPGGTRPLGRLGTGTSNQSHQRFQFQQISGLEVPCVDR